jgi:MFS family permease
VTLVTPPTSGTLPEPSTVGTRRDWRRRLPFFYGWLIVASAFVTLGITYTVWYSFSVFYVALLQEFGWGRAVSAGVFSLHVVFGGLAGILTGSLVDRFGPTKVVSAGALVMVAGLVACSQMTDLGQFYLYYGIICAAGIGGTGWVPCVTMISRWFSLRLGTAIGIASSGIGVGILVMVPVSQMMIGQFGWRTAYLVLAGIMFVGILPMSLLVMRGNPAELGLLRDGRAASPIGEDSLRGAAEAQRARIVDHKWAGTPWTVGIATRTRRYWMLFLTMALANVTTQMIMVHQVAFLVDGGFDKMLAASIVGLVGMFSIISKASWGWVSDRLGREITWSLGLSNTVIAIALLVSTRYLSVPVVVYFYSLFFAFGYGATAPLTPAVSADLFAGRRFGSIYGTLGVANGLGSAIGSWLAGYIFDVTGSYLPAFAVGGAAAIASIAAMWAIAPRMIRLVPGRCPKCPSPSPAPQQ